MHHTIDNAPDPSAKNQYSWQKEHSENLTGTIESYKPNKISKLDKKKKYETWKN